MISLTGNDLINVATNGIYGMSYAIPSFFTSIAIDKLSHEILNVKEFEGYTSYAIKAVAFGAGIAVFSIIAPEIVLTTFTIRKIVDISLFIFGTLGFIIALCEEEIEDPDSLLGKGILKTGGLIGTAFFVSIAAMLLGSHVALLMSGLGALNGSNLVEKIDSIFESKIGIRSVTA